MSLVWLVLFGAGKLSLPRWSLVAVAAARAIGCAFVGAYYFALVTFICGLVLFAGTVPGWIAARHGTRRDGDIAMAIFMGYAVGLGSDIRRSPGVAIGPGSMQRPWRRLTIFSASRATLGR